jgi:hypothetical protein
MTARARMQKKARLIKTISIFFINRAECLSGTSL